MKKILVTGASGFVGQSLCNSLTENHLEFIPVFRSKVSASNPGVFIDNIDSVTLWHSIVQEVDTIIHLAARVHKMRETSLDPLSEYRATNVEGTLNLARQAADAGVRRFIFISSIKVNGEQTHLGTPFREVDAPKPQDIYGITKFEAEQGLWHIARQTDMEVVIIRPAVVYGPGIKANLANLFCAIRNKIPLPLGAIDNNRSLLALDNLVSFIIRCIDHPKAANEIFLLSDGEDVSTTGLIKKIAKALGKTPLLIPVPMRLMRFAAYIIGRQDMAKRLFGSLQVDSSKARGLLGWKPVTTMDEQLKKTADAYLNEKTV